MLVHQILKMTAPLLILDVIAVYAYSLHIKGRYPPSHPWSGISLMLLSVVLILRLRKGQRGNPVKLQLQPWLFAAGAVISAGFWTVAAILAP
jgi:hypothetical protein